MSAWSLYYRRERPLHYGHNDAYGYAVLGIKNELAFNGFHGAMNLTNQVLGDQADKEIRAFQKDQRLEVDGVVGPSTALSLFRKRALQLESADNIPNHLLSRLKTLESGNDPGAIGVVDPRDRGLLQINSGAHPDVSDAEAFNPAFSLQFAATRLSDAHLRLGDWDAAIASWNVGETYAKRWLEAGKPASGGPQLGNEDVYVRATKYVTLVKKQPY